LLDQLDAAGLAATAGMYLRLDHPHVAADEVPRLHRLVRRINGMPPGDTGRSVLGEQLLALILVKIHVLSV
jgi:hypothetical protein